MMFNTLLLFLTFCKFGLLCFGGGYMLIPLLTAEFVGDGNIVRSQMPAAGVEVESARAKIIFYTDKEPEKTLVTVPDLAGKTAVAANEMLANRNLNIRIAGTNNYLSGSGAVAIAQNVPAGTQVEPGTVITVTFRNLEEEEWSDLMP